MSLRGTPHLMQGTETISQDAGKTEIAAFPPVARNDNAGSTRTVSKGERGQVF
jgi:hypothetical protein